MFLLTTEGIRILNVLFFISVNIIIIKSIYLMNLIGTDTVTWYLIKSGNDSRAERKKRKNNSRAKSRYGVTFYGKLSSLRLNF